MEALKLHMDCDGYYAACQISEDPDLLGKPMVVGGDQEARHGIVLAKSQEAKRLGIKTGNPLWKAREVCPNLVVVPADFDLYKRMTDEHRAIAGRYGPVQPYGPDEQWIDLGRTTYEEGQRVADEIRSSVYRELGITASIGVSYSKIVAKLGSDYRKPNGTTVIRRDNLKGMVWPLPAKDLFFVGPATNQKLQKHGIITIGDIANAGSAMLRSLLGKNGETIWEYANGLDTSLVVDKPSPIKSIGNRATYPRDLYIADEIKAGFWVLSEAVARRLRLHEFKAQTVSIYIRDKHLNSCERQMKVRRPTQLAHEIMETALALFNANRNFLSGAPVRSLGIKGMNLQAANKYTQLSFLPEEMKRQKWEAIELAMDEVRERFGHFAIQRGSLMLDAIGKINPFDDHTIHPVPYQ